MTSQGVSLRYKMFQNTPSKVWSQKTKKKNFLFLTLLSYNIEILSERRRGIITKRKKHEQHGTFKVTFITTCIKSFCSTKASEHWGCADLIKLEHIITPLVLSAVQSTVYCHSPGRGSLKMKFYCVFLFTVKAVNLRLFTDYFLHSKFKDLFLFKHGFL